MTRILHGGEPPISRARGAFVERQELLRVLELTQLRGEVVGVIHLDLDRFHQVNTRWGQNVGDQVLATLGPRLAANLPREALVAGAEGDSYLVVVPAADSATTRLLADGLLGSVRDPIVIGAVTLSMGASAGIACHGQHDRSSDLLEQAFLACRRAKSTAPGTVVSYEVAFGAEASRRQRTEDGLRRAVAEHELCLHLQPEVDLRDGKVVGVEALVRWEHPTDGLIVPADFLPVAESAGLMVAIGDWVFDEAVAVAARWRTAREGGPMRVWVNLAAQQLADGERLCARVRSVIADGTITAQSLGFEVTESTLLEDLPGAVDVLAQLRELGVEIALDDFGTGYSSLSYLRQLPVTAVKIDRSFVADIGGSLADAAIVEAVIDLAHALGLRVVAEGIEEVSQAEALRRMGADQAQGYYFAKPQPADELEATLARAWCGAEGPATSGAAVDRRADELPGFGSPRARLLLAALDSAYDSVIVTSATPDGALSAPIVYVNAAFETETGHTSGDVIGCTIELLLPAPVDGEVVEWFERADADGRASTIELANRRADGSVFLCELTLSPISDERGIHTHWLHVRRDLTQRRAAEGDRKRFEGLIEQSDLLVFMSETGGRWIYANAAQRRALGVDVDQPIEQLNSLDVLSLDQQHLYSRVVLPALERKGRWSGASHWVNRRTGEVTDVAVDVQMVDDPLRPGMRVFAAVSRDIGELLELERAERRRRELGGFAARLAHQALDQGRGNLFDGIDTVLGDLGRLFGADIAHLDTIDLDAGVVRPVGGWTSERFTTRQAPPAEIPLTKMEQWVAHLNGTSVLVGRVDPEHPDPWTAELAAVFPGQPIGTNLYAPLRVGGVLMGVLGLCNVDADHEWGSDELETVQQVADALANLVSRQRADQALHVSETRLAAMLSNVADILVVVDRDGYVRYVNDRVEMNLGYRAEDVIGWHFLQIVHPDDQPLAIERFAATLSGATPLPPTELRGMHRDGSVMWLEVDTAGVDDPLVGGYMVSLRNITPKRASVEVALRAEAALRTSEARLAALLDGSLDLVVVVDAAGKVFYANRAVERALGFSPPELVGRDVSAIIHPADFDMVTAWFCSLDADAPMAIVTVRLVRSDGSIGSFEITSGDMRDSTSGGRVLTCRDVTTRRLAEAEGSARVEHLRYAFDLAQSALDLDSAAFIDRLPEVCAGIAQLLHVDFVYVDQLDEQLGLLVNLAGWVTSGAVQVVQVVEKGQSIPLSVVNEWVDRLRQPEPIVARDVRTLDEPWAAQKRAALGGEGGLVAVSMSAAGELFGVLGVSMSSAARDFTDDEVTFVHIVSDTIAHVFERRRLDEALRASEAKFRLLSETAADVVLLVDATGVVSYASPSSSTLLGYSPDELVGRAVRSLIHPDDLLRQMAGARDLARDGSFTSETRLVRADSSSVWVASSASIVVDSESGVAVEYRISVRDITDRKVLEIELQRQALHDPLTGLGNRALLRSRIDVAVARRARPNHVSLLLLDLDGFKEVNDTYGHAAGDEVLRVVAARLAGMSRPSDTLARTGGDEFVLLCPETDAASALAVAERIVRSLSIPFPLRGGQALLGASVGVAHHDGGGIDPEWLLIEADHAMYEAKRGGRGCVRLAISSSHVTVM